MKVEEIIKLLDAGYSKDEIMEMNKEPEQQEESQEPEQAAQPEPEQQPEQQEDMTAAVKEFKSAIEDLKKEFIAANIMASNQAGDQTATAETAVANIINPFKGKE
jgi:DNA-binding transcriptional MerR regulator